MQKKKKGGQVGKRNQVVERGAETSVNPFNSLKIEKQIKENCQCLPGQNRSIVGWKTVTFVELCSALDNRLLSQVRNRDASQPGQQSIGWRIC